MNRKKLGLIDNTKLSMLFGLLFVLMFMFIFSETAFAARGEEYTRYYQNYNITDYKMEITGGKYNIEMAYEVGDILCTAGLNQSINKDGDIIVCGRGIDEMFFLTQYPFADASFDLCFISNQ